MLVFQMMKNFEKIFRLIMNKMSILTLVMAAQALNWRRRYCRLFTCRFIGDVQEDARQAWFSDVQSMD